MRDTFSFIRKNRDINGKLFKGAATHERARILKKFNLAYKINWLYEALLTVIPIRAHILNSQTVPH